MGRLGTIVVVLIIAYAVFQSANDADRDEAGNIIGEGEIDAFTMQVGDCFNDNQDILGFGDAAGEVQNLPGLPCSEPHDNEVYAIFDVSFDSYPGEKSMLEAATDQCLKRFDRFVSRPYDESVLDIFPIYPTNDSWSEVDDREVICAIYHIDLKKLTGSMRGSGI